jgi:hypothetical protein
MTESPTAVTACPSGRAGCPEGDGAGVAVADGLGAGVGVAVGLTDALGLPGAAGVAWGAGVLAVFPAVALGRGCTVDAETVTVFPLSGWARSWEKA